MRARGLKWGAAGIAVVSISFLLGSGAAWLLTGDARLPPLTGFALAALAALAYLVIVLERYGSDIELQLANAAGTGPRLTERIGFLEKEVARLTAQFQAQGSHNTTELMAEVDLLRAMVERLAEGHQSSTAEPETEEVTLPRLNMAALLQGALQESRVDLYLQPIVLLPDRRVAHYESYSRLRDLRGNVISPADYIGAAERSGLVTALDSLLLFRCINLVRKLGPRRPGVKLFVNISGRVLEDQEFLAELVSFVCAHRGLGSRVVLEAAARDIIQLKPESQDQLAVLSRLGFVFSVDHVTDLTVLDPAWLAGINVQYVKIDANVLLGAPCPVEDRAQFFARFEEHQISVIATRLEDEATLERVQQLGLKLAQGYLLGEPKPARADLDTYRKSA